MRESLRRGPRPRRSSTLAEQSGSRIQARPAALKSLVDPEHGVLRLRFADGLTGEVEVRDKMRGPVLDKACIPEGFVKVSVDPESGTVVSPGCGPGTRHEVRTVSRIGRLLR